MRRRVRPTNTSALRVRAERPLEIAAVMFALSGCSLGLDDIGPVEDDAIDAAGASPSDAGGDASGSPDPDASPSARADGSGDAPTATDDRPLDATLPNGGGQDGATASETSVDASPADSAVTTAPDGAACIEDRDCPQDTAQCRASTCVGGRCSAPQAYHLLAGQFTVPGAPAVPGAGAPHAAPAISAAYPYVFVVTRTGATTTDVAAFDVTSPIASNPRRVPILDLQLPAPVIATVAVGSVVYFVTDVIDPGTRAYQALAWVDVAARDAGPASLSAYSNQQVPISPPLAQLPTNITSLYNVLPHYPNGLFLIYYSSDHSTYYPTAVTTEPTTGASIVPYWNQALVTGADVAVESGSRLVAYTNDSQQPKFALVSGAGTPSDSVGPQITVPTPSARAADFAGNADGGVLWTSALLDNANDGGIATARTTLLLASGATASLAAIRDVAPSTYIDVENYPASFSTARPVVGPPVWIDGASIAIALAATHLDPTGASTGVHVLSIGGGLAETGFTTLPAPASTISLASSSKFAYALAAGTATSTVYVLAPLCP